MIMIKNLIKRRKLFQLLKMYLNEYSKDMTAEEKINYYLLLLKK